MTEDLHKLIHSLRKGEKREFETSCYMQNRTQGYLVLYDLLNKLPSYTPLDKIEERIETELGKPSYDLSRIKGNLRDKLLDFLSRGHTSPLQQIYNYVGSADRLRLRKVFRLAQYALEEAKRIGWKYEEFDGLEAVFALELKLPQKFQSPNHQKEHDLIFKVKEELNSLRKERERVRQWVKEKNRRPPRISMLKIVSESSALDLNRKFLSRTGKAKAILIKRKAFTSLEEFQRAGSLSEKYIDFVASSVVFETERAELLLSEFRALALLMMEMRDYDGYLATLEKIRSLGEANRGVKTQADFTFCLFSVAYSYEFGSSLQGFSALEKAKASLVDFAEEIHSNFQLLFQYYVARLYFSFGQPKKAMKWVNEFYANKGEDANYPILFPHVSLLEILIYFERGNYSLVNSRMKALERYLRINSLDFAYFPVFLNGIKKVIQTPVLEQNEVYRELAQSLNSLRNDPYESRPFNHFDTVIFCESKYKSQPFPLLMGQKQSISNSNDKGTGSVIGL